MSQYILVVEDNPSDQLITSSHVEKNGYIAITAEDAFKAIDVLEEEDFCMILVDLQMPRMGGIELIKRIKRMEKYKKTPIIVTSARKESLDVKLAIQSGAMNYIVKPIDSMIFDEKIKQTLHGTKTWQEYTIPENYEQRTIALSLPAEILSLNELTATIYNNYPIEKEVCVELHTGFLDQKEPIKAKVEGCKKVGSGYEIKVHFIGLTEETRKKIRLFCRKIYTQSQTEKEQGGPNAESTNS